MQIGSENFWPFSKVGRIYSNSDEFRYFEFQKSNSNVEFGRIRIFRSNSNEFDLKFNKKNLVV
jgi:hypothetical protein